MSISILDGNWKQHPIYTKFYFCDDGRVISYVKKTPKQVYGTDCGQSKYKAICVQGSKKVYLHRTVCELFNGSPQAGQICRHLDGDKYNNAATNLAWGSHLDNSKDMLAHGNALFGVKNPMAKLTQEQVVLLRQKREETKMPYYKLAKQFGVSTMTAFRAATKRSWK